MRFWSLLLLGALAVALAHVPAAQAAVPTFLGAGGTQNSAADVTVAWPSGHDVGDVALLFIESSCGESTPALSTAAGFALVDTQTTTCTSTTTGTRLTVYWARATSTSMTSPVITDPGNHLMAQILVYRGVTETGNPWNVFGGGIKQTASTSVTVTGVTTTVADSLVVIAVSQGVDSNTTAFSGWTSSSGAITSINERTDFASNTGNGGGFGVIDGTKTTISATGDVTASISNSSSNAFIAIALTPTTGPAPPPSGGYPLTQCAGDRFGSDLVCTANDVRITAVSAVGSPGFCTAGDFVTMNFNVTVNSATPDRWDIGVFFSNDGKDPQSLSANGGATSCSVAILPTTDPPFRNLDPGPHSGQADTCGDVNGTMNGGTGSGVLAMSGVTVKCQSKAGSGGDLWIPFILSWDNQGSPTGKLCQTARDPVPNTKSKCNAPTVAQATVVGVVVLPKIEKSDGITVIDRNQTTNYSVVITNNTGADVASATFKDPAVTNLAVNSVTCLATGGATCPTVGATPGLLSVANMQGTGVTITNMPAGSTLTFTVNATVSNSAVYGSTIANVATVTVNGQTNSATDTNTVGSTSLNHYELSLAASSVACEPSTVKVMACAGAATANPCTNIYSGTGLSATLATTAGTLLSTNPTFTTGVATTTLSYTAATNGATAMVSLNSVAPTASSATLCCQDGSCTTGASCTTTFSRDALFIAGTAGGGAVNIPEQTAGIKSGQFFVRAVKTLSGGGCDNALQGGTNIEFAYECKNPSTCYSTNQMKIETTPVTTITNNNSGGVGSGTGTYASVPMTFTNAGYAPFYLTYEDVGLMVLHVRYPTQSLYGASNAFVVKPYDLVFPTNFATCVSPHCAAVLGAGGANPAAADETGGAFVKAGSSFSAAITAVAANYSATPAFGRESPPETVKLTLNSLVAPNLSQGGVAPSVVQATTFLGASGGTVTGTNFSWGEVGIIKLLPSIGDGNYLSAGDVIGKNPSGNVGRFIPHHFKVSNTAGCSGGATFTYSGQPFAAIATARNLAGATTQNYRASPAFARSTDFSDASSLSTCTNYTLAAANYSAGVGTHSGIDCKFLNKETVPGIGLRAVDADSVTSADGNSISDGDYSMDLRSGRMRLFNVNGSELLSLTMPVWVEYYATVNNGWVKNTADTCTTTAPASLDLQNNVDNPVQGTVTITTRNPRTTTVSVVSPTSGVGSLLFSAPGAGGHGYADARMDLTSQSWLKYYWNGGGDTDPGCAPSCVDPTGRATFGTYRGNPRHIQLRELY